MKPEKFPKRSAENIEKLENEFWIQELKKISENFKEKGYNINFQIFFESHFSKATREQVPKLLEETDIYIPEEFTWTQSRLCIYQGIARGYFTEDDIEIFKEEKILPDSIIEKLKPRKKLEEKDIEEIVNSLIERVSPLIRLGKSQRYEYYLAIFKALLNSQKRIEFADIPDTPETQEILKQIFGVFQRLNELIRKIYSPQEITFEETLQEFENLMKEFVNLNVRQRDEFMINNIPKIISKILEEDPRFEEKAKKEGIKILIQLGGGHTWIWHILKKAGFETKVQFEKLPFYLSFFYEVIRRYRFNKQVSKDLLAKALAEIMFGVMITTVDPKSKWSKKYLSYKASNISDFSEKIRESLSSLSFDEIRNLFESIKKVYRSEALTAETLEELLRKSQKRDETRKKLLRKLWKQYFK